MTCANHPDRQNTGFCQHCGKPLCPECTRTAGTAVFCEPCLAARLGTNPQPAAPPLAYASLPVAPGEPSPTLAAILGVIPGVGAMYNGQYAKGIAHMIIFMILASIGQNVPVFIFFTIGWEFFQMMEAYHTARARRDGTILPNPFGLNDLGERLGFDKSWQATASPQEPVAPAPPPPPPSGSVPPPPTQPYSYDYGYQYPPVPPPPPMPTDEEISEWNRNRVPAGAFWLIALGMVFLLGNLHIFPRYNAVKLLPLALIGFGIWLFIRGVNFPILSEDANPALHRIRTFHAFRRSFWMVLVGFLWLLNSWSILRWKYSWPFFLIAGGVALLVRRAAFLGMDMPMAAPSPTASPVQAPGTAIVPKPYQPDSSDPDQAR